MAPKLVGGEAPRILEGTIPEVEELELAWLLEHEGELFARYRARLTQGSGPPPPPAPS